MREHELEMLLNKIGLQNIRKRNGRKGTNFMFSCPRHTDRKPSAGVVLDGHSVYGFCYSCKWKINLIDLIAECLNISKWDAIQYVNELFYTEYREFDSSIKFRQYEEGEEVIERFQLPLYKLAPFRSGKGTHKYFFRRGFNKDTVEKFLIGWDKIRKRITVPVFYQDGLLAGIIGRTILNNSDEDYSLVYGDSPKYLIYEHFPIGEVLFGEHLYDGSKIVNIVEGTFDEIWMHQLGFTNTLSTIIANFTEKQRDILFKLGIEEVVLMYDNDAPGRVAGKLAYDMLKPFFKVYKVQYPDKAKDVMNLDYKQIKYMLDNKKFYGKTKFKPYI